MMAHIDGKLHFATKLFQGVGAFKGVSKYVRELAYNRG